MIIFEIYLISLISKETIYLVTLNYYMNFTLHELKFYVKVNLTLFLRCV